MGKGLPLDSVHRLADGIRGSIYRHRVAPFRDDVVILGRLIRRLRFLRSRKTMEQYIECVLNSHGRTAI